MSILALRRARRLRGALGASKRATTDQVAINRLRQRARVPLAPARRPIKRAHHAGINFARACAVKSTRRAYSRPAALSTYARALCKDAGATLDDLREAVTTLEDAGLIARRVLGGMHPFTKVIEDLLRRSRAALRAHGDVSSICEAVGAMTT